MRKLLALLVVLAGAIPLFGQGTSFPVFNRQGWTMAGAVVSVCNGPADPGASAIPCIGVQTTTYVDWTLTTTCTNMTTVPNPPGPPLGPTHGTGCTNPGLTDSHGNATIFAANGFYWAQVAGYQVVPQSFPFDIGSGSGGGLTPCGQPTDIQNYFTNIALGCDTGIGILDPSQHLISENHLNANQQVSVGNGTANGLMCQGHSNGTAIDAAYCTQPSATFATTGLGYGLFPPDNQPTAVGNVVTISSLTTTPVVTAYGTIGFYPTHFVTNVSGLVFCELMSPLADCNAPLSGGTPTNDIIRAFYDVSPLLVWQGPPIGAGGMPYGFNVNQCQDNTGSLSSAVCPFISSLTAGDAILVSIVNDSGGTLVTPTDTLGNTFTALNVTGGTGFWYAKNVKAGLDTVTVGLGAAGGYMVQVLEAAGADPTAPVDVGALSHPSCSGTGPQTLTFSALTTTTQDGIIVLNTMSGISGGPYGTFTPGTLFLPTNSQTTHYGGGGLGASRSISTGYIPALITGLQTAPTMVFTNLPSGSCGGSTAYTVALKPANADGPQKPHYGFISLDMLDYANGPIPNPAGLGGDAIVATADGTGYTLAAVGAGTVTNIATTAPLGGGPITTTGTLTCTTCLVASSPGAGILRVAGSTQTATSAELSGDATTSGSNVVTLATVNSNVGSFTAANITVNAKGLIIAAANGSAGSSAPTFPVNAQTSTYTATTTDFANCKLIQVANNSTPFTVTLVASGSQPGNGQCIWVENSGNTRVQIARNGQNINGGTATVDLQSGHGAIVTSDGTNYFAQDIQSGFAGSTFSTTYGYGANPGSASAATLIGYTAGNNGMTGTNNTCVGYGCLQSTTSGAHNTFVGYNAGGSSGSGGNSVGLGESACAQGVNNNSCVGFSVGSSGEGTGNILIGTSSGVQTPNSTSTNNYLNIGNQIVGDVSKGILIFRGPTTTIASNACGSTTQGTLKTGSNDMSGEVTVGTATVTACAVSFANSHTAAPNCIVSSQVSGTVVGLGYTASTTTLTVTATSGFSSTVFDYFCPSAATSTNPTP